MPCKGCQRRKERIKALGQAVRQTMRAKAAAARAAIGRRQEAKRASESKG